MSIQAPSSSSSTPVAVEPAVTPAATPVVPAADAAPAAPVVVAADASEQAQRNALIQGIINQANRIPGMSNRHLQNALAGSATGTLVTLGMALSASNPVTLPAFLVVMSQAGLLSMGGFEYFRAQMSTLDMVKAAGSAVVNSPFAAGRAVASTYRAGMNVLSSGASMVGGLLRRKEQQAENADSRRNAESDANRQRIAELEAQLAQRAADVAAAAAAAAPSDAAAAGAAASAAAGAAAAADVAAHVPAPVTPAAKKSAAKPASPARRGRSAAPAKPTAPKKPAMTREMKALGIEPKRPGRRK